MRAKNLFFPSFLSFALSAACFLLIQLASAWGVAFSIVLFVINAISMTAALTFLLTLFPIRCMDRMSLAAFVGILNFCVHLGDFASSTAFGWLSASFGWSVTFSVMTALALIAAAASLFGLYGERKRSISNA